MDETKLVLLPEAIYYDLSEQRYSYLYYPDYEPEGDNPYEEMMDYLLEHIDTEDRKLTDSMYRIYELSEGNYFHIEDALRQLDECGETEKAPAIESVMQEPEDFFVDRQEEQAPMKEKTNRFYPIFAGLSVCGIAAVIAVYYLYELSSEEMLILIGCAAMMGVCLLICLAAAVRNHINRGNTKKKINGLSEEKELYDLYNSSPQPVELGNVLSKDMDICIAQQKPKAQETFGGAPVPEAAQYGNTIFFETCDTAEYKLYAMDKKNKSHIALEKFPCTVGKMAGCVDHVLSDESVSRIHARFDRQDNHIFITDMNSTNGTYKNGLRMQPQETMEIEPGDELRFGNLHYCYR
jgi:hypothetical protein